MRSQPCERRHLSDRRRRPTCVRLLGVRRGFRRAGEGKNERVDCPADSVLLMVLLLVCASGLDAWFTLVHIQGGAIEANPFMELALRRGPQGFIGFKMALTTLGVVFLAIHSRFRLGLRSLQLASLVYGLLLVYHVSLLWTRGPA